ncbi:MAG TPA: tRNA uridine-5-carboxymethylaminomethyl(34) synthesis GTPase MnmE [Bacillota bacterium]|nr:tRNA uridine-5-carboxymethylaminomethyl(34) synthesis GTPase MnmE [Bacillota bacterium]
MYLNDTIAAIATPIGEGGIGIIRMSGPDAKKIGELILRDSKLAPMRKIEDHRLYYGWVIDPGTQERVDEALWFYLQKPRSFTVEDTLEIQAHGGNLVLSKILNIILQCGARLAMPGEFTLRAYLNGRIDLVQAESIIDLIRAKTDQGRRLAVNQLTGNASQTIYEIENTLYQILITLEALLDFPEEGIPELQKQTMIGQTERLKNRLKELLANIDEGQKIRDGISIVIIGRPNVGKSTLLNTFLQEERAIVTEIPGTTRDVIEAQIQISGVPIRLYDTAGLRETENPIEQLGIQKTEQYLKQADLILFVLDGSQPFTAEDQSIAMKIGTQKVMIIINKADLKQLLLRESLPSFLTGRFIETSLKTGDGFGRIEAAIREMVGLGDIKADDLPLLSRVRHKRALEQAIEALERFRAGLEAGVSEDLLAVDLRDCLGAIGEITGKNVGDEVLQGIFSQFCIGK